MANIITYNKSINIVKRDVNSSMKSQRCFQTLTGQGWYRYEYLVVAST